jgi:hypothetical protein
MSKYLGYIALAGIVILMYGEYKKTRDSKSAKIKTNIE